MSLLPAEKNTGNGVNTDRSGQTIDATSFPPIRPGGSLLLAWQIRGKLVLLVGGGVVAAGRLTKILEADAKVRLVAPRDNLSPEVHHRLFVEDNSASIDYIDSEFDASHLNGIDLVLTAIDSNETSTHICALSRALKIPVNIADVPPECDFYFGSEIRTGALQVLVSTNGKGPKLANQVRRRIQASLPADIGTAIENVGVLRAKLRERAPGVGGKLGARRMKWMIDVCECFTVPQLAALDEVGMERVLRGWEKGVVPGGRKGCPLGYVRSEQDAGCPWGFKRENGWLGVTGDSRVRSAVLGVLVGVVGVVGVQRFWGRR